MLFFRKYQLPCSHVWQQHILYQTITPKTLVWRMYGRIRALCCRAVTTEFFEGGMEEEIGAPARRRLNMREALDDLTSRYFDSEDQVPQYSAEDASMVVR